MEHRSVEDQGLLYGNLGPHAYTTLRSEKGTRKADAYIRLAATCDCCSPKNIALFEPVPEHVEKITEDFRDDDITLYQVALGSEEKTMQMNVSDFEGQNAELYKGMSTSLLKPSIHLEQYPHIKFNESIEVEVTTLDILAEEDEIVPEDFNFMNIDVQGYEYEVIKNGNNTIKDCLIIQLETSPIPIYKNEKSFAHICLQLENLGFQLHSFNKINTRCFKPVILQNNIYSGLNHLFQLDCVFIKKINLQKLTIKIFIHT